MFRIPRVRVEKRASRSIFHFPASKLSCALKLLRFDNEYFRDISFRFLLQRSLSPSARSDSVSCVLPHSTFADVSFSPRQSAAAPSHVWIGETFPFIFPSLVTHSLNEFSREFSLIKNENVFVPKAWRSLALVKPREPIRFAAEDIALELMSDEERLIELSRSGKKEIVSQEKKIHWKTKLVPRLFFFHSLFFR